ncbi:MAG: choice-of-anchor D domain-containing protein [Candidatus Acidiferrales bacterium]
MRRLVIVCAVTALVIAAFLLERTISPRALAQTMYAPSASPASGATNGDPVPVAVASNVAARSLSLDATSKSGPIFLTTAIEPNRIFTIAKGTIANGATLAPIAGKGDAGFLGDGGAAAAAQFNLNSDSLVSRSGIAVAADGTIFIADSRNATIRRIAGPDSSEPRIIRSVAGHWAPPQNIELIEPMGLGIDRAGNLYIADRGANSVLILRAATGQLETLAHVIKPASIAVTLDGSKVFTSSADTGAVISIDTRTRALQTVVKQFTHDSVTGAIHTSAAWDGKGTAAGIPSGIALDGAGNLFIAAENWNLIFRLDAKTGELTFASANRLQYPGEMAFNANGDLFVADQGRNQIVKFQKLGVAASNVTLAPAAFDFGDEPQGGTTPAQAFTLMNNLSTAITGISISFQGGNTADFTVANSSCATTLAANSSCAINVAFAPKSTGARASTLSVANSDSTETANVSGTGDDYSLALATGQAVSVTVMNGSSATYMLQATNDATFTGVVTFVCPGNLPRETSCTFTPPTVNFTAPNQTIPFSAVFQTTSRTPPKNGIAIPGAINSPLPPARATLFPALAIALAMVIAAIAIIGATWRGFRSLGISRARIPALLLVMFAIAAATLGGCHHPASTSANGTPAGTTNLTIQATAQNASRPIVVTLVVQ